MRSDDNEDEVEHVKELKMHLHLRAVTLSKWPADGKVLNLAIVAPLPEEFQQTLRLLQLDIPKATAPVPVDGSR